MSRLTGSVARAWRKSVRAYHVACAREELRVRSLQPPVGVWVCEKCRFAVFDRRSVQQHAHAHAS